MTGETVFLDEVFQLGEYGQPVIFLDDCQWVIHRNVVSIDVAQAAIEAPDYATGPIQVARWGGKQALG